MIITLLRISGKKINNNKIIDMTYMLRDSIMKHFCISVDNIIMRRKALLTQGLNDKHFKT